MGYAIYTLAIQIHRVANLPHLLHIRSPWTEARLMAPQSRCSFREFRFASLRSSFRWCARSGVGFLSFKWIYWLQWNFQIWWLKSHPSDTISLVKWHSAFSDSSSALLRCKPSTSWSKSKHRRKSPEVITSKDSSSNSLAHHGQASAWTRGTIQSTQPKHSNLFFRWSATKPALKPHHSGPVHLQSLFFSSPANSIKNSHPQQNLHGLKFDDFRQITSNIDILTSFNKHSATSNSLRWFSISSSFSSNISAVEWMTSTQNTTTPSLRKSWENPEWHHQTHIFNLELKILAHLSSLITNQVSISVACRASSDSLNSFCNSCTCSYASADEKPSE